MGGAENNKPERKVGRPFKAGQSGNPGGRPKGVAEVQALAQAQTPDSIAALIRVRDDPKAPHQAVVAAATALLDRGWGKPVQPTEITGANGGPIQHQVEDGRLPIETFLGEFMPTRDVETKH